MKKIVTTPIMNNLFYLAVLFVLAGTSPVDICKLACDFCLSILILVEKVFSIVAIKCVHIKILVFVYIFLLAHGDVISILYRPSRIGFCW